MSVERIAELERRIRQLESGQARRPIWQPPTARPQKIITVSIIGGNVLSSGGQGIKSVSSLTSVPVKYDPATDTSFIDGIGYGLLGLNGVYDGTRVLVVNNGGGLTFNSFPLIANNVIISSGAIFLTLGGGPDSISAYTVG